MGTNNQFQDTCISKDVTIEQSHNHNISQCPVCDGVDFEYVFRAFTKPDHEEFSFLNEYYLECNCCGTTIKSPLEVQKEDFINYGKNYYDQMTEKAKAEESIINHIKFAQIPVYNTFKRFIDKNFPANHYSKWLDVGSAGYPTTFEEYCFTTIEPDNRTVEIGKRLFKESNIVCSILDNFASNEKFDGIVFHHSFYCLPNPNDAIQKCKELLSDNGIVIIAIGQFFMDTPAVFEDNLYNRVEDIYRGETLSVYYNPFSLEYIFRKHGFCLEKTSMLKHEDFMNPEYSSRYFVFKRTNNISKENGLLSQSFQFSTKLLLQNYKRLMIETKNTLEQYNSDKVLFIGNFDLFNQLNNLMKLDEIYGFIDINNICSNKYKINGVEVLPYSDVYQLKEDIKIVVCSYTQQDSILRKTIGHLENDIFIPTRKSNINFLFFTYRGKDVLTKAFILKSYKKRGK